MVVTERTIVCTRFVEARRDDGENMTTSEGWRTEKDLSARESAVATRTDAPDDATLITIPCRPRATRPGAQRRTPIDYVN